MKMSALRKAKNVNNVIYVDKKKFQIFMSCEDAVISNFHEQCHQRVNAFYFPEDLGRIFCDNGRMMFSCDWMDRCDVERVHSVAYLHILLAGYIGEIKSLGYMSDIYNLIGKLIENAAEAFMLVLNLQDPVLMQEILSNDDTKYVMFKCKALGIDPFEFKKNVKNIIKKDIDKVIEILGF
jgi:hypothetical protein